MRVSTNVQSLRAQRYLREHTEQLSSEDKKLSSGERIVTASDDPAGLAISEKLKAHIRSNQQVERNANDSISLLQVAEGSLGVMNNIGIRLRELSMQAASDTITDADRIIVDQEFQSMKNEVLRLTESTSFNGNKIINDKGSVYDLQVGINGSPVDRIQYDMKRVLDSSKNFGIGSVDLKTKLGAQESLSKIDHMISQLSSSRAELGSISKRMDSIVQGILVGRESMSASNSKIRDADMALEISKRTKENLVNQATLSMLQNANNSPAVILKLVS